MKKRIAVGLVALSALGLLVLRDRHALWSSRETVIGDRARDLQPGGQRAGRAAVTPDRPTSEVIPEVARQLTAEEKAACLEKIRHDYEELRQQALREYGAAGEAYPGGLYAFLRLLALLERERRSDFSALLSAEELEALEWQETRAGQRVARALGAMPVTEEQRRAVFRLERDFDLRFDRPGMMTAALLLERERARYQTQEEIRRVLGDGLFEAWLATEDGDFARARAFAAAHQLASSASHELRQVRNEFFVRQLELHATPGLSADQLQATRLTLVQHVEARAQAILGPVLFQTARTELLGWLPPRGGGDGSE